MKKFVLFFQSWARNHLNIMKQEQGKGHTLHSIMLYYTLMCKTFGTLWMRVSKCNQKLMDSTKITRYLISFRKLSRQWLWWEDRVRGEPPAAAVPQLAAVQLSWSQALWKHSEKMADQSGPPPQPRQLRQETSQ